MSGVEHTRGPWRVCVDGCGDTFISGPEGQWIADLAASADEQEQLKADAHLIAASPELLEAAEKSLALIEDMARFVGLMALSDYGNFNVAPIQLSAAIAKARGAK